MPRLWDETIEAHRRAVHDAVLDAVAALVTEHGLRSVTMSRVAERAGIGRATLYKYFSDVETILLAWHERQLTAHLAQITDARDQAGDLSDRLRAVLETYALMAHRTRGQHDSQLAALLHRAEGAVRARQQLDRMVRDLLTEGADSGDLRDDIASDELATYCLHALAAASEMPTEAAVRRLVSVTMDALRASPSHGGHEPPPHDRVARR